MQHEIILETPRLLLRKKVVEDAPFFFELNSNILVTQYTGDGPFENLKAAEDIAKYVIGQYQQNGYGRWMVIEKETNKPIGWCGLKYHSDTKETDIGYRFLQSAWGKGFATESAKACLDYGFIHFNLNQIIGNAMKANSASINVFKKLGMTYLNDTLIDDIPSVTYQITK
jgi:ribosomal-protein-alanine N-acetyltransferase